LREQFNFGFPGEFLPQTPQLKIGPATELKGLRALPYFARNAKIVKKIDK
jgi:hypothetical protein